MRSGGRPLHQYCFVISGDIVAIKCRSVNILWLSRGEVLQEAVNERAGSKCPTLARSAFAVGEDTAR